MPIQDCGHTHSDIVPHHIVTISAYRFASAANLSRNDMIRVGKSDFNGIQNGDKVAFVGDLVFVGRDPLIHRQKGGTSIGYIATLKKMLDLDVDTYLSGHADPVTKAELKPVLASLEEKMAKVQAMVKAGNSIDDVRKAFGIEAPAAGEARRPSLVEVIYLDLTEKK